MKTSPLAILALASLMGAPANATSTDAELIGTGPSEQVIIGGASAFRMYWKVEKLGKPVERTRSASVWRYKNITCELIVPFPRDQAEIGDAVCHVAVMGFDRK